MNKKKSIDLNCDMGESFGRYELGNDAALLPLISSCNIACGFHAGDPLVMRKTVDLAVEHGVKIGAHPSFPDLAGFGRRAMQLPSEELKCIIQYQIAALQGVVELAGGILHHIKPHGALYNQAGKDTATANAIVEAIAAFGKDWILYAPYQSELARLAQEKGIVVHYEAFADRAYIEGRLLSRKEEGAVLHDPKLVFKQVLQLIETQSVDGVDGINYAMPADTICVHGDNPRAVEIVRYLAEALKNAGIQIG